MYTKLTPGVIFSLEGVI